MKHSSPPVVRIGLIQAAFQSQHVPVLMAGRVTHDPALKFAAQLVFHADDDELVRSVVLAALPEKYSGDTPKELPGMITSARRKGFDEAPARSAERKPRPTDVLADLFEAARAELFHDPLRVAYVGIPTRQSGVVNVAIGSERSNQFLQELYFRATRRALPTRDLDLFTELMKARATFEGGVFPVFIRVGGGEGFVCHDLGGEDGAIIEIDAQGYTTTFRPNFKMIRSQGMRALPRPRQGAAPHSGLMKFKRLMGLDDTSWALVLAFLLGALRSEGPYPVLMVEGEQGSGKSLRCELCKRVIDPTVPMRSSLPENTEDLMIIASHQHMIIFDNLSGVKNDMSDALAALSTKAGFQTRKLYANNEIHTIEIARPFALNGIGEYVHRPDLMDRAIPLHLEAMPEGARRTEREMRREFEELLPELLHDLYTAVAHALANLASTPVPTQIRMADAAHWFVAAEQGLGLVSGTIITALEAAQDATQSDLATQDSLFPELEQILRRGDFDGRPTDLLSRLQEGSNLRARSDRFFPSNAGQLSTRLRRLRGPLAKAGIIVEFPERTREGRRVVVRLTPEARAIVESKPDVEFVIKPKI
jgi:hypothetical protein